MTKLHFLSEKSNLKSWLIFEFGAKNHIPFLKSVSIKKKMNIWTKIFILDQCAASSVEFLMSSKAVVVANKAGFDLVFLF